MAKNEANIIWKDRKRTFLGLPWSFTVYKMSEDRLFVKTGFLNSNENEVRLYRILDVSLRRTLGQKLFGLGTIVVSSSDKTLGNFEIKNVKKSRDVKEKLSELVEMNRDKKKVTSREYIGDSMDMDPDDDNNDVE